MDEREALKIMSLPENYTKEKLRKRYIRLVKKYHPDLHPEKFRKKYTLKLREINEAYRVLLSNLTVHSSGVTLEDSVEEGPVVEEVVVEDQIGVPSKERRITPDEKIFNDALNLLTSASGFFTGEVDDSYHSVLNEVIMKLLSLITSYPSSPLVPDALYYIGLSQFNLSDFKESARTFLKLIKEHKSSPRFPPAMLFYGKAMEKLGKKSEAKKAFELLIKLFPDSIASRSAELELEKLLSRR